MREYREKADEIETSTFDLRDRHVRQRCPRGVVEIVLRVEVEVLEARIGDIGPQEVDDWSGDIDADVALDRNRAVEERLREPHPATEIEYLEPTQAVD